MGVHFITWSGLIISEPKFLKLCIPDIGFNWSYQLCLMCVSMKQDHAKHSCNTNNCIFTSYSWPKFYFKEHNSCGMATDTSNYMYVLDKRLPR